LFRKALTQAPHGAEPPVDPRRGCRGRHEQRPRDV